MVITSIEDFDGAVAHSLGARTVKRHQLVMQLGSVLVDGREEGWAF